MQGAAISACKPFLQIMKIKYSINHKISPVPKFYVRYLNVLEAASLLRLQAATVPLPYLYVAQTLCFDE